MSGMPKAGEFCWTELATSNVKAAKDFYSKAFGWMFTEHEMDDTTYTMIQKDDKAFGGIWAIPKEKQKEIQPHWMVYILVENAEKATEKARQAGGKVIKPVTKAGDMGLFSIIADPTGAHFAVWQPLKMGPP